MANPQPNKFTRISNEVLDHICRTRIPGEARQVFDFIMRKTWGWNKKSDFVALSQVCLGTCLSKVHVCQGLSKLIKMNLIITEKGNGNGNKYMINKDFDTWKSLPKKVTLPNSVIIVTEKGNKSLPKKVHTKDNYTKDNKERDGIPFLNNPETPPKQFTPPTLDDIDKYITDNKYTVNAKIFYDYFTSSGWIDGKGNKVKNWKQKLITWQSHQPPATKPKTEHLI
jgi:phage replication O-like protein O